MRRTIITLLAFSALTLTAKADAKEYFSRMEQAGQPVVDYEASQYADGRAIERGLSDLEKSLTYSGAFNDVIAFLIREHQLIPNLGQRDSFDPAVAAERFDRLGVLVEGLESRAEPLFDGLQGLQRALAAVVLADVFPQAFGGVQFGAAGRQRTQLHAPGHVQLTGSVPAGPVQEHHAAVRRKGVGRMTQEYPHGLRVHPGQYQRAKPAV
jgi:hypothetical protein